MLNVNDFDHVSLLLAGVPVGLGATWATTHTIRYALADTDRRAVLRKAFRIKHTWNRTARRVGLAQTEKLRPSLLSSAPQTQTTTQELIPAIKVKVQTWGVSIDACTIGQVGLQEFQDAAEHLADAWRVPLVRVEQLKPGVVRIRALLRDPLTSPMDWMPESATAATDPGTWVAGIDADGREVSLRSSGVSGIVVAGLAGYGKTSFLNHRFCQLAPSEAVQFVLIDGKGGPDYDDLFQRAWLHAKDEPEKVRDHLSTVHTLMMTRQRMIRETLHTKNMWALGPSRDWPLVVILIDEAHTFLNETKGGDTESRRIDALARETARLAEELIRKGRNVGVQVILATQKATGDAIPTKIRDNCQVAVSFAQRTSEAATAVLGSDITDSPDEHPRRLQDPGYIGVASMVAEGRPGFTLVRTPYVPDETADRIAADTAHLVRNPLELLTPQAVSAG